MVGLWFTFETELWCALSDQLYNMFSKGHIAYNVSGTYTDSKRILHLCTTRFIKVFYSINSNDIFLLTKFTWWFKFDFAKRSSIFWVHVCYFKLYMFNFITAIFNHFLLCWDCPFLNKCYMRANLLGSFVGALLPGLETIVLRKVTSIILTLLWSWSVIISGPGRYSTDKQTQDITKATGLKTA